MDLSSVLNILKGMNFWSVVTGIISGILIAKILDEILFMALAKFWPEKYLEKLYAWVKEFDDKAIDSLKSKYPKSAKNLEDRITAALMKMVDIINDKI